MNEQSDSTAGIELVPVPPKATINLATANTKVFVALPWQKNTNPMTAFCVAGLIDRTRTVTCMNFGDAFVAHSRNKCAELFLASSCEWMLMVDDDVLFPFGNARWYNAYCGTNFPDKFAGVHAIDRLLSHKKTLIGGLYFGRHKYGSPMFAEGSATAQEAAFARKAPMDLIKPTRWVATGCILIHRRVFEAIEKRFPRLGRNAQGKRGNWFSSSEHTALEWIDKTRDMLSNGPMTGEKSLKAYSMLEQAASDARNKSSLGMGEDVAFSVRAAEAGHQPYVDFGLVCGHIGHCVYGPWNTFPKS